MSTMRVAKLLTTIGLIAATLLPAACRDGGGAADPPARPATLTIFAPDSLVIGQAAPIAPLLRDASGAPLLASGDARWSVSDTAVATVAPSASGGATLTARALGTVVVTAVLGDRTATRTVRVVPVPARIVSVAIIGPDSLELGQLSAYIVEARDAEGYYYYLGDNPRGYLALTTSLSDSSVLALQELRPGRFGAVAAQRVGTVTLAATANGVTARRTVHVIPVPANALPTFVAGGLTWRAVAAGDAFTCGLTTDGAVHCWGLNDVGQLGVPNVPDASLTPVRVALPVAARWLSAGPDKACAVGVDGSAYCWGSTLFVAPIAGSAGVRRLTIPVPVAEVAVGPYHSCAATAGGEVYCLGLDEQGQLGAPASTEGCFRSDPYYCRTTPAKVQGTTPLHALAVGSTFTCGLATDGSAYCWGNTSIGGAAMPEICRYYPRTGGGPNVPRSTPCTRTPLAVTGGHHFTALAAGGSTACGVRTDGAVLCWSGLTPPVEVIGVRGATAVSVGPTHTCAVADGGAVLCWGSNAFGQLGAPESVVGNAAPVAALPPASPATAVAAGSSHTCSVRTDGRAVCWGNPRNGRLGQGVP